MLVKPPILSYVLWFNSWLSCTIYNLTMLRKNPQIAIWRYLIFRPNSHWLINEKSPYSNNRSQFRIPSFFLRKISHLHPFIVASSYTRAPWLQCSKLSAPCMALVWNLSVAVGRPAEQLLGVPPEFGKQNMVEQPKLGWINFLEGYVFPAQTQEKNPACTNS